MLLLEGDRGVITKPALRAATASVVEKGDALLVRGKGGQYLP